MPTDDTEPIGADDIVRAARDEAVAYEPRLDESGEETARAVAEAVIRTLARDGATWEADILEAMADEIEARDG